MNKINLLWNGNLQRSIEFKKKTLNIDNFKKQRKCWPTDFTDRKIIGLEFRRRVGFL